MILKIIIIKINKFILYNNLWLNNTLKIVLYSQHNKNTSNISKASMRCSLWRRRSTIQENCLYQGWKI